MAHNKVRHVFLTGSPGVGKTTLTKKICQTLLEHKIPVEGFYTEEVRDGGRRIGFDIVDINGIERKPLARIGSSSGPKVGQYSVLVADFESVALPKLNLPKQTNCIVTIDEIGKMELFSKKFESKVELIFNAANGPPILATIPIARPGSRQQPLVEKLRRRVDCKLILVDKSNRDDPRLLEEIICILVGN